MPDSQQERPVVLWLSGRPGTGKSSSGTIFEYANIRVFRTDDFVARMPEWVATDVDRIIAKELTRFGKTLPGRVGEFLDRIAFKHHRPTVLAKLLLDKEHGFQPEGRLSVIEGYMPLPVQDRVAAVLEVERGFYVWYALRPETLERKRTDDRWR